MAKANPQKIVTPANLDPALSEIIVVDYGDWGRGADLQAALSNIPGGKRRKLESHMQVWHVTPGTTIDADGKFRNPESPVHPVLNESRRKTS